MTFVVAITACFGVGLVMLAPVLVWLAVKNRRDARWVRRHPVSPAAAVRLGVALPQRYAVFGRTAPGPAGTVRTLLAGTPAVWCRTMVYTLRNAGEDGGGEVRVLFEQTFGEPFGVADSTGTAAVSGNFLEAFLFHEYPPLWRRTRIPEGQPGERLVHRAVDELTAKRDEPGPYLRAAIERGLVGPGARRSVDIGVLEEYIVAGQPLHVIGKPAMLDGGVPGLTMPRTGRYLIVSREPAETEAELVGDGRFSLGCGLWALLAGAVAVAVSFAVAYGAGLLG